MKKHVQDVASHQHPDSIRVNEHGRNFGMVKELFEKRRKGKAETRVELLIAKESGIRRIILRICRSTIQQVNRNVV